MPILGESDIVTETDNWGLTYFWLGVVGVSLSDDDVIPSLFYATGVLDGLRQVFLVAVDRVAFVFPEDRNGFLDDVGRAIEIWLGIFYKLRHEII